MIRVQVTLKSGRSVNFLTEEIERKVGPISNATNLAWTPHGKVGVPNMMYLDLDEVAAVVTYALADRESRQDEQEAPEGVSGT